MRRKNFSVFMLVMFIIAGLIIFVSCGEKKPEGPVHVIFYLWDDPAYEPIIKAFNDAQTGVIVDAQFIPTNEYEAKINTLLAGGVEMDGYMQKRSTDIFAHYANGYLAPLDDLCKKYNFDLNAIKGYKSAITIDNKTMAIPFRGASYYTYYNKKIFEQAGMATPDTYVKNNEWTWPRFIEVSKSITAKLPDTYGGFLYTWGSNNVIPALQNGMQFVDADGNLDINHTLINCYKYRKELEKAKAIMPLTETKVTKTHYSKAFYSGKVGMLIIGEWFPGFMIKGRDENQLEGFTWNDWSLARIPCDESSYRTFGNPTFSHVHINSKKKDAMFKFISWMGGPEGATIVAGSGLLPAYVTDAVKNEFKKILPDDTALAYYTEPVTVNTQFYNKYGSKVESELAAIMEEYLGADMSDAQLQNLIEQRLKQVAEQIQ
ncbi:MAG: extracellular solute-binding protein [Spirochaetales bacterium]|nr:extracellular solute-binding protein [Spirochaetales bacterium]